MPHNNSILNLLNLKDKNGGVKQPVPLWVM